MEDISQIILDLVQNSLAADSTIVHIKLEVIKSQDLLICTIKDNGKGMNKNRLDKCTDPFYTTRTTRSVGLGLSLAKMLCEQTGGFLEINSAENEGTHLSFAFGLSHWDRPPYGRLDDTYISLLILNPNITFNFEILTEKGNFQIDSSEIYENIKGSVITEGWIIDWLRGYLRGHFHHLLEEEFNYNGK